ncbi:hypothetical protein TbgDal_II4060 [Trypanosoma brucei gambiense DAL972]|uniref:Uncharacterized protein n=1 Tax=Trypanosoma brucei gambiense (strain MHOM/CI/86/DAL972) TaxID=679716 RepID=C9ZJS0_TRYB9|nr:hypothetical protein TbgDal_II4060 [Trypanosoma brucei gambiense DAL972]CBH09630.1 hypothetical protein TbgDal_II4060 [Trypanosoma brucei gambiense DAL972]|eukprot:XP_011771934.1 hypothetical protein TbgDal_II4060 [Trypanosoma brucei gambiense DAL972]
MPPVYLHTSSYFPLSLPTTHTYARGKKKKTLQKKKRAKNRRNIYIFRTEKKNGSVPHIPSRPREGAHTTTANNVSAVCVDKTTNLGRIKAFIIFFFIASLFLSFVLFLNFFFPAYRSLAIRHLLKPVANAQWSQDCKAVAGKRKKKKNIEGKKNEEKVRFFNIKGGSKTLSFCGKKKRI